MRNDMSATITLSKLQLAFQFAMGCTNSHEHEFVIDGLDAVLAHYLDYH